MARLLSIVKNSFILPLLLFTSLCYSQEVSQERLVRFSVWASTESFPGVDPVSDNILETPANKIRELAPFIVQGMVYGWKFDYTPSDKARGVKEYFEFEPLYTFSDGDKEKIQYKKPWIENSRVNIWVEFNRSIEQINLYKSWLAIVNPRIKGVGYAKLSEGFEGIQNASKEALKQAVREYERKYVKTKPKQITGRVLMSEPPLIGIDAGRYKVTLEFFMETDKIIEYKTF